MVRKRKKKWGLFITWFTVFLLTVSGLGKILGIEAITERLNRVGVGRFMIVLGIVELLLALLFVSPKTMKLSFILLSCYFSGAIATEISHRGNFIVPFLFLLIIWIASFMREKSILKLASDEQHAERNPWNVNWAVE